MSWISEFEIAKTSATISLSLIVSSELSVDKHNQPARDRSLWHQRNFLQLFIYRKIAKEYIMRIEGNLSDWFETGSEGSFWIIEQNGLSGMAGVHFIKKDDHLKIISASGQVVFEGVIEPDSTVNDEGRLMHRDQPTSCGRWIHWYQKGFDPDLWGSYFFSETYTGVLMKSSKI